MATNFPGALDVLTNPVPTSDTVTVPHSSQHANANDSIEALEAKVGVNGSAVTTSHDYKLGEVTGADKAVGKTATQVMTNKTLGAGSKVLVGSDATGDTYYNGGSGTVTRRAIGSEGQVYTVSGGIPAWSSPSGLNTNYGGDTGAANAYVVDLSPALGAYIAGTRVEFKAVNANTTTSTVNVNGLGVKTIKKLGGATNLASGDIAAGMVVELEYDGTNFVMLNPSALALNSNGDASQLTNIPGGKLNVVTTDVTFNNTTTETNILSYSVPGGTLGTSNAIRITIHVPILTTGVPTGTDPFTFRFKYGGTTLTTLALVPTAGVNYTGKVEFIIAGAGTTGTQNGSHVSTLGESAYAGAARKQYFSECAQGTSSVDSTTAQTLLVTGQYANANVSNSVTIGLIVVERIN